MSDATCDGSQLAVPRVLLSIVLWNHTERIVYLITCNGWGLDPNALTRRVGLPGVGLAGETGSRHVTCDRDVICQFTVSLVSS